MEKIVTQVFIAVVLGFGRARCEPPLNNHYGVPGNFPSQGNHGANGVGHVTNSYGAPIDQGHDHGHDGSQNYIDGQPKSYEFGYAVKDAASGNDFGRQETSDGETVRGEYRVQLPDGRTQIVTYTADWRTGFHADVRYEGVATFPDQYSNNNNNNNYNNNNNNNYNNGNNVNNAGYNSNYNANYNSNFGNDLHGTNYNNDNYNYNNNNNHNYNNYETNSLDNNYRGYSSNTFSGKSPSATYGTPSF